MRLYSIAPPPPLSLPIEGSDDRFPVRRIYCVGKNYNKHVAEMGGDPQKSKPIFFTKSRETIVQDGANIAYPPMTSNLHFEVELVVAMKNGSEIFGYGTGIDMTRRDLQAAAKSSGAPWDMAKNFDNSAPCSAILPAKSAPDLSRAPICLHKNGQIMQNSSLDNMIWSVGDIITALGKTVTLSAGDLIYTGTPEGVGAVVAGDTIIGTIAGLPSITVSYSHD